MSDSSDKKNLPPQSAIKQQKFTNFLSSLFGWRRTPKKDKSGFSTAKQDIQFVSVDLDSEKRTIQTLINNTLGSGKLSSKLEELFNSWLQDTSDSITEISDRFKRVDQLTYAAQNDPFIGRIIKLYADEATQLDVQNHLIHIETPDPRMTRTMYDLLIQWGITQPRVRAAIAQLAQYGDCFWAASIQEHGVEKIIPLKQLDVTARLEFSPAEALERLKRQDGFSVMASKFSLIQDMLDSLKETGDFADLFNKKLFGYVIYNDLVVPPWNIVHFRVDADGSEFYPFGVSPILGTLAPFKLTASTITLQSIARVLSFPVTLFKVKTASGADEARQFNMVNRVREEYDNIGVSPAGGNTEVYTVNTKIWMPDGLMDVDVKSSQVDIGFTGDIEMYQDRTAVATGVPKGYLVQEWGGFGNSAISLVEQFKPFARSTFSLQSAFLEGLSYLFRLHFALTQTFDHTIPFTLSMNFPAEESSSEKNSARSDSLEMAAYILDLIRTAIGADEDESLPIDIVRDILAKYTFLDPTDIVKWTKTAKFFKKPKDEEEDGLGGDFDLESDFGSSSDFDLGDLGGGEGFGEEGFGEEKNFEEPSSNDLGIDKLDFGESLKTRKRLREERLRELSKRYKEIKYPIYFQALREFSITEFVRARRHVYVNFYNKEEPQSLMLEKLKASGKNVKGRKLSEAVTLTEVIEEIKKANAVTSTKPSEEETTN